MAIIRCSQGHYYDDQKFSRCPHCGIFTNLSLNESTEGDRPEDQERTVAMSRPVSLQEVLKKTVFLEDAVSGLPDDDQKTIGYYSDTKGNDFVTGWLVCVKGPEKGRDYRLYHGFNRIGRGFGMTICIADDIAVSRENHCAVVYDDRSNTFSLVPQGGNLVYKDGEQVLQPILLKTGDVICIGKSELEFVAFCREGRVWEKE